ncbi:MAG: hypothetical protein HYS25_10075 [Ignavibacteriales bacterium]|nr:hypothetical protein [Ignavibacteriales bacterium]
MSEAEQKKIPRELSELEKYWLFKMLPSERKGYNEYRKKIEQLLIIGSGRFGNNNFYLGKEGDVIDLSISSSPVIAAGEVIYDSFNVYVTIHEEFEDKIEIDLKKSSEVIPENLIEKSCWSYSEWLPAQKAPYDNSVVREVAIIKNEVVLAIAPHHKKIWVYNCADEINYLIPVSNFYGDIIRVLKNHDPKIALNPNRIFTNTDEFSDEVIAEAFFLYNRQWKKFLMDSSKLETKLESKKKKSFLNFFRFNNGD